MAWALEPSSTYDAIHRVVGNLMKILLPQEASPSGLHMATMVAATSLSTIEDADAGACFESELLASAATSHCGGLKAALGGLAGHCCAATRRMSTSGAEAGTSRPNY